MLVEVIIHNLVGDTFVISNSKKDILVVKDNSLYVHKKWGCFVDGEELIETFDTKDECIVASERIYEFIKERKSIRETINLTLKDIKGTEDIKQKELLEKFLWIMESKFLKYDNLYIKDII